MNTIPTTFLQRKRSALAILGNEWHNSRPFPFSLVCAWIDRAILGRFGDLGDGQAYASFAEV